MDSEVRACAIKWVMAIDVGLKKTGVAVGQTITKTAQPVAIIHQYIRQLKASAFREIVEQWHIDAIIIGQPAHKDGSEHPLDSAIARLAAECELEFERPVYFIDEYLTSHEAKKREPKAKYLDAVAATIIAEDWLESYRC